MLYEELKNCSLQYTFDKSGRSSLAIEIEIPESDKEDAKKVPVVLIQRKSPEETTYGLSVIEAEKEEKMEFGSGQEFIEGLVTVLGYAEKGARMMLLNIDRIHNHFLVV